MKDKLKIIGFIIDSYAFWIFAYIISLIGFSLTGNKIILSGACGVMLFFVLASSTSFDCADDKEKKKIYQFIQWIALVSIFFILQHFLHIFTNVAN